MRFSGRLLGGQILVGLDLLVDRLLLDRLVGDLDPLGSFSVLFDCVFDGLG